MVRAGNRAGNGDHIMRYMENVLGSLLTLATLALVVGTGFTLA